MITLESLAKGIEQGLNLNTKGIKYKIFADGAKYARAVKTRYSNQSYNNGILSVLSSSVVPVQGLSIASSEARLEICVPLPLGDNIDYEPTLTANREVLEAYFKNSAVMPLTDDSGMLYTVGVIYSLANTGTIELRGTVATSITYIVAISYSFIENGLNSFNCLFFLDDVQIPYITATATNVPVMDPCIFSSNNIRARNFQTGAALSFEFVIPSAKTALTAQILNCLYSGINPAKALRVKTGDVEISYSVIFAQNSLSLNGVLNGGIKFGLIEGG